MCQAGVRISGRGKNLNNCLNYFWRRFICYAAVTRTRFKQHSFAARGWISIKRAKPEDNERLCQQGCTNSSRLSASYSRRGLSSESRRARLVFSGLTSCFVQGSHQALLCSTLFNFLKTLLNVPTTLPRVEHLKSA